MVDNTVAALHLRISILIITSGHLWPMGSTMVMIIAGRLQQIQEAKIIPTWQPGWEILWVWVHLSSIASLSCIFLASSFTKFKCYNHRQSHPLFSFSSPSQSHRLLTLIIITMRFLRVSFFNIMMRLLMVILMLLTVLVKPSKQQHRSRHPQELDMKLRLSWGHTAVWSKSYMELGMMMWGNFCDPN